MFSVWGKYKNSCALAELRSLEGENTWFVERKTKIQIWITDSSKLLPNFQRLMVALKLWKMLEERCFDVKSIVAHFEVYEKQKTSLPEYRVTFEWEYNDHSDFSDLILECISSSFCSHAFNLVSTV